MSGGVERVAVLPSKILVLSARVFFPSHFLLLRSTFFRNYVVFQCGNGHDLLAHLTQLRLELEPVHKRGCVGNIVWYM